MLDLEGIKTERVEKILVEVENLLPDKEISIVEMTDEKFLKISDGAAVTRYLDGKETIYLDPIRADEYRLIHEIMHVKLRREGWPQIDPLIPEHFTQDLAMKFDNLIDHYVFSAEIEDMEIDCSEYREKFTTKFDDWKYPQNVIGKLKDSFIICEALLFGEPYKTRAINSIEKEYPESLNLALKMEEIITSSKLNKEDIRKKTVKLLNFVGHWDLLQNHPEIPFLRHIIGISPVFTKKELNKKASKYLEFKSEQMSFYDTNHALDSFILKSDKTRIKTYVDNNPSEIFNIRKLWRKQSVNLFLESYNIRYGLI